MKKIGILLTTIIMAMFFVVSASALENGESEGKCGDDVYWHYSMMSGVLTIKGTGDMYNEPIEEFPLEISNAKTVIIENGVTSIADGAFSGYTYLETVKISKSVTSIGDAFWANYRLNNIVVDAANPNYCSASGVLFDKNKTELIQYPVGNTRTSYTVPSSVISIKEFAFAYCDNLNKIILPDSLTSIESYTFVGCTDLKNITIPNSVTSIGTRAFAMCVSLESINIPNGVASIEERTFAGCTAFKNISLPDSVTSIGVYAFYACEMLENIILSENLTSIGSSAFESCESLENITIPDSVTSIGEWAFGECYSLKNLTIPNSVTSIGTGAFALCTSLDNMIIPDGVTYIGQYAFYGCTSLEGIDVDEDNPQYSSVDGVLFDKQNAKLIQYPAGNDRTEYTILDSVRIIYDYAFAGCENLTDIYYSSTQERWNSIRIGENNEILSKVNIHFAPDVIIGRCGDNVYYSCDIVTGETIISGTGKMYDYPIYGDAYNALFYDLGIKTMVVESGVTHIGNYAFAGCESITDVTLPESITSIGSYAFYYCLYLESLNIPDSVTSIDKAAFAWCFSLKSIAIPNGITNIEMSVFNGCVSLENVTIPNSITSIGPGAFAYCESLKEITIPNSVTQIEYYAFYDTALTDVYYEGTKAQWKGVTIGIDNKPLMDATIHCKDGTIEMLLPDEPDTPDEPDSSDDPSTPENPSKNCSCKCHKGGLTGFFWKISNFFNKLFRVKSKQMCACGVSHY